jgi:hypothetical protein
VPLTGGGASTGAAAPAVASAAANGIKAAKGAEETGIELSKIKAMFEKLKKCFEQIQAVQKAIADLNKIDPTGDKAVRDMKSMTGRVLPLVDAKVDFAMLKLNWEEFQVDMNARFSSMEETFKSVDGYSDWKNATQKFILRAYAVISASKNFQEKYIALSRIQRDAARVKARQEQLKRLAQQLNDEAELAAKQPKESGAAARVEKRQLRLTQLVTSASQRAVNRWLFLDFHQYALAIMYSTARKNFPVALSTNRPLKSLLADIVAFKQALSTAKKLSPLSYPVAFKASDGVVSGTHWKSTITETKALSFAIPTSSPAFKGHRILRVKSAEVYIDGLKPATDALQPSIQISVSLGPRSMVYTGSEWQVFHVHLQPMTFDRVTEPDGSQLPDTATHPRGINQAAVFSAGGRDFAPSLLSRGSIRVLNPDDWRWDDVQEVRLNFYCEADQLD